jgi:hypothetical protein
VTKGTRLTRGSAGSSGALEPCRTAGAASAAASNRTLCADKREGGGAQEGVGGCHEGTQALVLEKSVSYTGEPGLAGLSTLLNGWGCFCCCIKQDPAHVLIGKRWVGGGPDAGRTVAVAADCAGACQAYLALPTPTPTAQCCTPPRTPTLPHPPAHPPNNTNHHITYLLFDPGAATKMSPEAASRGPHSLRRAVMLRDRATSLCRHSLNPSLGAPPHDSPPPLHMCTYKDAS